MGLNEAIINKIKDRLKVGAVKYGEELNPKDGRDWLEESIEELLDACVYLSAKLLLIKDTDTKLNAFKMKIEPDEVITIHTALEGMSSEFYLDGNSKQAEKVKDLADKIKSIGKI